MEEGYSCREISRIKNTSLKTAQRTIKYWLDRPPEKEKKYTGIKHLICDGSLLKRNCGIYAVMNADNRELVKAAYGVKETNKDLLIFYQELSDQGLKPLSATVDGSLQQIKYLRKIWPEIIIQRCIVHVQRQGLSWCRMIPKRKESKELRELFLQLCCVKTQQQVSLFIKAVCAWEQKFGSSIEASTNRGRVFSDIIRARSMLLKALPDLFHYITNPDIPRTTNAIEGYFSRMKELYRLHRGLAVTNRINYFDWYFFLKPK